MTLDMADSIYPQNLPDGWAAYLGYVDGEWPTAAAVRARFPAAKIVTLTVVGGHAVADGCDRESGDLSPDTAARWVSRRLAEGAQRPIVYASVSNVRAVLDAFAVVGVRRSQVRLLSAHYQAGKHICGPATCRFPDVPACDGTQWTDSEPGVNDNPIDASELEADFFDNADSLTWQEKMMQALPEVKQGATGPHVRTVQGLCVARGHDIAIDGEFGPNTKAAVEAVQNAAKVGR